MLTKELTRIADLVAPLRLSKGRGKAWWNRDTEKAIKKERRAQRTWLSDRTDTAWQALRQASLTKKKEICAAKTATWRNMLYEASS